MPTVPDSPDVSGPRKRKLSTKVTTNGDPNVERKRKKSEQVQKKSHGTAPAPKKKPSTTATAVPKVAKQAVQVAPAKPAPRRRSVEVEEVYDEVDHHTSVPPRNPRHILEAADGSDDDMEEDPAPELITIDDDDEDENMDTEKVLETPEESAEAELSMWYCLCVID
jgi:hypothetical protein